MSPQDTATAALHAVLAAASCHGQGHGKDCGGGHHKFHLGNMQLIHFSGGQMADALFVVLCIALALLLAWMCKPQRRRR